MGRQIRVYYVDWIGVDMPTPSRLDTRYQLLSIKIQSFLIYIRSLLIRHLGLFHFVGIRLMSISLNLLTEILSRLGFNPLSIHNIEFTTCLPRQRGANYTPFFSKFELHHFLGHSQLANWADSLDGVRFILNREIPSGPIITNMFCRDDRLRIHSYL